LVRDPTISENYIALRNALLAIQDDSSAVLSVLSSLSDGGGSWVAVAYYELRRSLVQGRLQEAETLGRLIGLVLDVQEKGSADELAENRIHRESTQWLIEGIGAILNQDNLTGIKHLERLTEAVYCNESLQWVAWLWTAKAASAEGDLIKAKIAAEAALALSATIDPLARATSLTTAGGIEFLHGETEKALVHLHEATATFEEASDRRGMAYAYLTMARMLVQLKRNAEGLEAARKAQQADSDWEDPVIYLSQMALLHGSVEEAGEILRPIGEVESKSPEFNRQRRILEALKAKQLPLEIVREYLKLKEQPPNEANVSVMEGLWLSQPTFLPMRELLAWTLLKLAKEEEAAGHFQDLTDQQLDPEIHASVLLGLGCLANRRNEHRQPAARVKAAASALPPSLKPVEMGKAPPIKELGTDETVVVDPGTGTYPAIPGSGPKAVFTGDLQLFAVPDLLDFLKSSRRTGTLVVTSECGIGAVHLRQGMITGAASPNSKNMGDLLLQRGALTEQQLHSAADFQRADSPERLLGSILLERGLVKRESLRKVLEEQIRGALLEMVGWSSGRFAFEPDKRSQIEGDAEMSLELDTHEVLLDVLRVLDERNRVD
jgi:tetratricopeptide (TPR) repeat protein